MELSKAEQARRSTAAMSQESAASDSAASSSMPSAAMSQQSAAFDDAASTSMPKRLEAPAGTTHAIAPPGDPMDTVIQDAVHDWYALNGKAPNVAQVYQMTQGPPPCPAAMSLQYDIVD